MFKKILAAVLLVTILGTLAFRYGQGVGWENFNSPEGRFNILMPTKPKLEVKEVDSRVGKLTLYAYSASNNTGYFIVSYADYPAEPNEKETMLDAVRTGVLNGLSVAMSGTEKKIAIFGYPGREFSASKTVQDTEVIFTWRIYLVGRRLYQLAVVTPKADANSPDIAKFLTSFELSK